MELIKTHNFLGKGWKFPPEFDNKSGQVLMTEGAEDVNKSIYVILTTRLGERKMYPRFGCAMDKYIFATMDTSTRTMMEDQIRTALLHHEARIDVEEIEMDENEGSGTIDIRISYKIRGANSRYNYVFPFYLIEADNPI